MSRYYDFFEAVAQAHPQLRHGEPVDVHNNLTRKAYFRSDAEATTAANNADTAETCLVVEDYAGKLRLGSNLDEYRVGGFEIRVRISGVNDYAAQEAAKETCRIIGVQICCLMQQKMEQEAYSGPIPGFDIDSVVYEFTGPYATNQYGCSFIFDYKDDAPIQPYADLSSLFPNV